MTTYRIVFSIPALRLILMLIIIYPVTGIYSQEVLSPANSNSIGLNFGNNQIKENILLPKAHKGSNIGLSYRYEYENRSFHEFAINIGYSRLKTNLETDKVTWNGQVDAGYTWGKNLISGGRVNYYLGVNLNYLLNVMEYPVWDESRAYWGTVISAGPFNRIKVSLKNNSTLISTLRIDIAGFTSRPDRIRLYAQEEWTFANIMSITNSHFSFSILDSFIICSLRNEYRISLKNDNFISLCNYVTYAGISSNDEEPVQNIRISFGAGFGF